MTPFGNRRVRGRRPAGTLPLSLLFLAACGGGGGGGGAPAQPVGNLRVASVRIVPLDPNNQSVVANAAHEMILATTIEATVEFTDVPVSYVLLHKQDVDQERDPVRQHQLSSSVIATVRSGTNEYETVVGIPREVNESGQWYLLPRLDPADAIKETDETDNEPTDLSKVAVEVGSGNTNRADIVLETATVDQDAVILWPEGATRPPVAGVNDQQDHDFGVTLEVTSTGWQMLNNTDLSASIIVPGAGAYSLRLWDEDQGGYVNRLFTTITPGIPNSVHVDAFIPGSARREVENVLRTGGSNVFRVELHANRSSNHAQWEMGSLRHRERQGGDDNIAVDVVIVLPPNTTPPCNELLWNSGYKKDWRNSVFGIGVDFGTRANLDENGATAEAHAKVPVKLFSLAADAVSLRAFANVRPRENLPTQSRFDLNFDVFGVSIFATNSTNPSYTYNDTKSVVKSYERRSVVFAGPVPIQLRAMATGTLGYRVRGFLDPARMELEATAFADLTALAEASVSIVIASAGVAGSVTLVHDEFTASATCTLGTPSGGRLLGTLDFQVVNDLRGPEGRLYVFEEHPEIKWCWTIIPCGFRQVRNEKTLVRFQTFRKRDVLFHKTQTSSVCL